VNILIWIIVGLIAGWLAGLVVGTRGGVITNIILGIVGAVVGGFLASALLGVDYVTGLNIETIIVATLGAIITVLIVRALPGRSPV
jgi:uncharacterized membrane protein YeaQ/YmgE (transglycosylase-associated protein family)